MRLGLRAFWAGCGLFAASMGLAAGRQAGPSASLEALRARCPTTRNLAPAAFADTGVASAAALDAWQQRVRGNLRIEGPPPDADVVLRAFAGGSITQSEPSETATMVWRLPDGSWHFIAANHYPNRQVAPPPPPATLSEEEVERARRSAYGGPLDEAQAAALDRLLADPCLDAEPSNVGAFLAVPRGMRPMQPCYDAVPETVELVRAGRRRVYVQTCHHFLAGELISLALYPHRRGEAPAMPASRTLATLESARRFADQALRAAYGGEAWVNATEAAGTYAFVHRAGGFRCAATQPSEIEIFGPNPNLPAADGASCYHDSSLPVGSGAIHREWRVARPTAGWDVARHVRKAADDWYSSYYGSDAHPQIRTGRAALGGMRMSRAEVAGERNLDARDDELTIVLGAEHDGWIIVARATGSAANPAAVEAAALREWRRVVETRVAPPR